MTAWVVRKTSSEHRALEAVVSGEGEQRYALPSGHDHDCRAAPTDEFFIGWLALPPGYSRFARRSLVPAFTLVFCVAWWLSSQQQSPGAGQWQTDRVVTLEGLAMIEPYARLFVPPAESDGQPRTVLLVEQGKFGAAERLRPFAGKRVRVQGVLLHRADRWMLELLAGDDALRAAPSAAAIIPPVETDFEDVRLRGEIIDPKCYLGAMKPGGGKTHKACAVLCLSGGVPPMFVTRDADRRETFFLLTAEDGTAIVEPILPFVGDPIEVTGTAARHGDLRILRLDTASIRRL